MHIERYLIGVDIGTSSTKAVLTDERGRILSSSTEFYSILTPRPAWAECWPDPWVKASKDTIRNVVKESGVDPKRVEGMCISGLNGGSGIPLDKNMEPIRPCIIWMDRRAGDIADRLGKNIDLDKLYRITENGVDSYYGFTKMLWIKENEPENWERTAVLVQPNHYVIYKLTGELVTDYTTAGNIGGIYDFEAADWSDEMLGILGIPREKLPSRILSPTDIAGGLTAEAAKELGLREGLPVAAGCVDCLASTLAAGAVREGDSVVILSTSLNWGLLHKSKPNSPRCISMPYVKEPKKMRHTLSAISTAGAITRWYSETFACESLLGGEGKIPFDVLEKAAANVPAGSNGLIMLPYFMGERSPIWDTRARSVLMGLSLRHTQADIYHAVLESVGYALRHIMEDFDGGLDLPAMKIVGGGSRSVLWTQIISDITGVGLDCMGANVEAPFGDAFLAAVAVGVAGDFEEIESWSNTVRHVRPQTALYETYSMYYNIYKSVYISLKNDMHALADLTSGLG